MHLNTLIITTIWILVEFIPPKRRASQCVHTNHTKLGRTFTFVEVYNIKHECFITNSTDLVIV